MMAPILLILLSGLFEFGFLFVHYLAVLDSARNAARFSSDSQFDVVDADLSCASTLDFYRQTACMALDELAAEQPTILLCLPDTPVSHDCPGGWDKMDDVIVSVFSVLRNSSTIPTPDIKRFPMSAGEQGWSFAADYIGQSQGDARNGMHVTQFSSARVMSKLHLNTPNTGYVLVEINYNYHQVLALPWFTQFVHDPVPLHLYAMWPLVSAEPTSTPK
jgi:hypothetical protein